MENKTTIGLNTLLNDKKTSTIINDALNSPVGSTKREQAASLLKMTLPRTQSNVLPLQQPTTPSAALPLQQPTTPSAALPLQQPTTPIPQSQMEEPRSNFLFPAAPSKKQQISTEADNIPKATTESNDRIINLNSVSPETITVDKYEKTLSGDEVQGWNDILKEAVEAGIGKETFYNQIMNNEKQLNALEDANNLPHGTLPSGIFLSGQLAEIDKTLKEKYKIETLEDNLKKLKERDIDLGDQVAIYIRSRDTYVKQLDTLLDKANQSISTTSNPWAINRLNNYKNFLTVLKGKQQQNYSEYVKWVSNINQREIEDATKKYNDTVKKYNEAKDESKESLKDKRTVLKGFITDMYSSLEKKMENIDKEEKNWRTEINGWIDLGQKIANITGQPQNIPIEGLEGIESLEIEPEEDKEDNTQKFMKDIGFENLTSDERSKIFSKLGNNKDDANLFYRYWKIINKLKGQDINPIDLIDKFLPVLNEINSQIKSGDMVGQDKDIENIEKEIYYEEYEEKKEEKPVEEKPVEEKSSILDKFKRWWNTNDTNQLNNKERINASEKLKL